MSDLFDQTQLRLLNESLSRMMSGFRWPGSPKPSDIPAQNYAKALRIVINRPQTPAYLGMAMLPPGKHPTTISSASLRQVPLFLSPLTPFQPAVVQ